MEHQRIDCGAETVFVVLEVAVAGVPDEKRGETVRAWIVKEPESTLTEQALVEWSQEWLAKYKYPRIVEFRDQLLRTTVDKVLKRELVQESAQEVVAA